MESPNAVKNALSRDKNFEQIKDALADMKILEICMKSRTFDDLSNMADFNTNLQRMKNKFKGW